MDEHHVIISADSHCGADLRQYKDYLETKYHDEFDEWADVIEADQVKMDELYAGLEKSPRNVGIGRCSNGIISQHYATFCAAGC